MSLTEDFFEWVAKYLENHHQFQEYIPKIDNFDLSYKRSGSLMKGRQTFLFKLIPSDLTLIQAQKLRNHREVLFDSRSSFFKLLQDILVFFYVSEQPISSDVINSLADFSRPKKKYTGNVIEINILLELYNGSYIIPQKTGLIAWRPLKKLREEITAVILEPYQSWREGISK